MERVWMKIQKRISDSNPIGQGAALICGRSVFLRSSLGNRERFLCKSLIVHGFQVVWELVL